MSIIFLQKCKLKSQFNNILDNKISIVLASTIKMSILNSLKRHGEMILKGRNHI